MKVTNEYIERLFTGTDFGPDVNDSIEEKRRFIKQEIIKQRNGHWSGHTSYHIMLNGGFIIDSKNEKKKITLLGIEYLTNN